jgi:glutathione S-transferase
VRIYGDLGSGNCQKVKATADFLGIAYDWIDVDITKGESRTPAFLAMNPAGQVPVVLFDDGRALAQSNAIVRYLARGSSLIPDDPFDQAKADEWMFWEQYSHEPYVAVARYQRVYLKKPQSEVEPRLMERGEKALDRLEAGLAGRSFLVGERLSVADIALLPYTRLAHEGGFDLAARPAVRAWIKRCEGLLRFGWWLLPSN